MLSGFEGCIGIFVLKAIHNGLYTMHHLIWSCVAWMLQVLPLSQSPISLSHQILIACIEAWHCLRIIYVKLSNISMPGPTQPL